MDACTKPAQDAGTAAIRWNFRGGSAISKRS
jgi:hypothetical protein